ncbi:pantoate--beta-alanine ligase [candidate division KSB1 bacterium]|nr:pantoate--beta-alanine ligase [candidate division KSB1 bacterium]
MVTIKEIAEMQALADEWLRGGSRIGCVPTMGALHEGHVSLVHRARELSERVVVSIFVNPIQFGPQEDYKSYPRPFERDLSLCEENGADAVFIPAPEEMYAVDFQTHVAVEELTTVLCGATRPGHFQGVTTVVAKLFNIMKPNVAVFGAKDYQQAVVIKRMVRDLNFDINIVVAPTVREPSGLAVSSRNNYLSEQEKVEAATLYQALCLGESMIQKGERTAEKIKKAMHHLFDAVPSSRIDYIEIVDADTLQPMETIHKAVLLALAVFIGPARLIDNKVVEI